MPRAIDWESRIGRRVRLRDLHVLSAVVESGSMVKGAAHLGVSQPVVSQAIADLEAAIGHRLLDRNSRGVEPTAYGLALLKHGQMAFDDLRQGIREIEHLASPEAGEVWIGCPESLAGAILPPIIEPLARKHPRATFHVSQSYTLSTQLEFVELRERKLDLVLARLVRPFGEFTFEEDLTVEHLFDDDLVVVAGRDSPWARRRKIELKELADVPWVLPPKSWNLLLVKEAFQAAELAVPPVRVETFSVALRNQLLDSGRFIAAVPGSMLRLNARHALKALPVDLPKRPWPVVLVTLKNRTVAPMVQLFIQAARTVAASINVPTSSLAGARKK
jgi:DNA-binding transcriptional LysR family regulator